MSKILIASQNIHKIEEIAPILQGFGFEVTDARMHVLPEPVEDSGSFIGNARIKAVAAMEATGMAVIADDSGLIVDALGDFPGVETAPYARECGGYPQAVADIFKKLDGRPSNCHYFCVLLVKFTDGAEIIATGKVHGRLIETPRGDGVFGFDPWFEIADSDKTFAEISATEKSRISHRGLALQDLLHQLKATYDVRAVS
jgi:XTP/dITP diphosphohydrolase